MSFLGSTLGNSSGSTGSAGLNFSAAAANLQKPVTADQLTQSYDQSQSAINQQQQLVAALQGQNGIQNQSQVYNQLQASAAGRGPNPAQAQLAQATGANVSNQAALMAGQRGASSNAGLMARQAAQQGAGVQQQAAGQAATMQAQQSQNAMNQLAGLSTQQVNQQMGATQTAGQMTLGEQQQLLNANSAYNNASVGMTNGMNNANAAISQVAAQGQNNMVGNFMTAGGLTSSLAHGGEVKRYDDGGDVESYSSDDSSGASSSPTPDSSKGIGPAPQNTAFGGGNGQKTGGGGAGGLLALLADGGSIGAPAAPTIPTANPPSFKAGDGSIHKMIKSNIGKWLHGSATGNTPAPATTSQISAAVDTPAPSPDTQAAPQQPDTSPQDSSGPMMAAKGGKVPALVSPGERYLPPSEVKKVAEGKKNPIKAGEKIPGKAKVSGDSTKNDIVPKTLTSGGIVLPRSVVNHPNAPQEAAKFVSAILAKKGNGLKKGSK